MKNKNLLLLFLITAALVGTFFLMRRKDLKDRAAAHSKIGAKVLPDLDLDKLSGLKIFSGDELKVEISKSGEDWTVANLYNYPVAASKLRSFTADLSEMKILKNISASEQQLARFGLDPKDISFKPIKVKLNSASGKIAGFLAGKKRLKERSADFGEDIASGRFITVSDGNVLVTDEVLHSLEDEASDWIDKEFFSAGKLKTASLSKDGKIIWSLSRTKEHEDMNLENIPDGRKADGAKVSEIAAVLSHLSFAKIADPKTPDAASGLDKAKIFTAEDFEGIKYQFRIGKKENNEYFTKVSAEFAGIEKAPPPENEKDEDKNRRYEEFAEKEKKAKNKINEINGRYAPWLYMFPEHKIKTITTPFDELLEKPEEEKEEKK